MNYLLNSQTVLNPTLSRPENPLISLLGSLKSSSEPLELQALLQSNLQNLVALRLACNLASQPSVAVHKKLKPSPEYFASGVKTLNTEGISISSMSSNILQQINERIATSNKMLDLRAKQFQTVPELKKDIIIPEIRFDRALQSNITLPMISQANSSHISSNLQNQNPPTYLNCFKIQPTSLSPPNNSLSSKSTTGFSSIEPKPSPEKVNPTKPKRVPHINKRKFTARLDDSDIESDVDEEEALQQDGMYKPRLKNFCVSDYEKQKRQVPERAKKEVTEKSLTDEAIAYEKLKEKLEEVLGFKEIDEEKLKALWERSEHDEKKFIIKLKRNLTYYKKSLKVAEAEHVN